MDKILAEMLACGIRGGSLLNPERGALNKILISAVTEEQARLALEIVNKVTGGLDKANTGIFMTLPILNIEGLAK